MGCGPSAFELAIQNNKSFKKDLEHFKLLQLSQSDVGKLFNVFNAMDANGGGTIDLCELLAHIDLPRTAFTTKVFSIFDDNNSGSIDFKEFVLALWNYCTLTKGTLDTFAFDLYDSDGSGELSSSEVLRMIQDIFGKSESRTNAHIKQVTTELQDFERRKVVFTIERFRSFAKTRQAMLFPPFQMLQALQAKILGISFWEKLADKRMKLSNGKFLSVGQFIAAHNGGKITKAQRQYMSLSTPGPSRDDDTHLQQTEGLGVQAMDLSQVAGPRAKRRQSAAEAQVRAALDNDFAAQSKVTTSTTTSIKPSPINTSASTSTSIASSLSESAKAVWAASLQGLSSKNRSSTGILKTNKVHVAPSPSKALHRDSQGESAATMTTSSGSSSTHMVTGTSSASIQESPVARKTVTFPANSASSLPNPGAASGGHGSAGSVVSPRDGSVSSSTSHRRGSKERDSMDAALIQYSSKHSPKAALTPSLSINSNASTPTGRRLSYGDKRGASNTSVHSNHSGHSGHSSVGRVKSGDEEGPRSFGSTGAFVPHDDANLAVKSRARRTTILPGAVEDPQGLTELMYHRRRSFG